MEDASGIESFFPDIEGFCHPDWFEIGDLFNRKLPEAGLDRAWTGAVKKWLSRLAEQLDDGSTIHETKNFMILSAAPDRVMKDACKFYEKALRLILKKLNGVAQDEGNGPHVVLMFARNEDYYRYISPYYGEEISTMSSGIHLVGRGYSHFAFPVETLYEYRSVLVHELTHGCLLHLPIPLWLNEALAMRMEATICDGAWCYLDHDLVERHEGYWNAETIQHFWSGEAFQMAGDSQELSYHLSQVLWEKIESGLHAPREAVLEFAREANFVDAGEAAFQKVYELSLNDLAADFLGEGNWLPDPNKIETFVRSQRELEKEILPQ